LLNACICKAYVICCSFLFSFINDIELYLVYFVADIDSPAFSFQLEHSKYANLNDQLTEASLRLRYMSYSFFI
jgi:hypothetical protein